MMLWLLRQLPCKLLVGIIRSSSLLRQISATSPRLNSSQTRAKETDAKIILDQQRAQMDSIETQGDMLRNQQSSVEKQKDRESNERVQLLDFAQDLVKNPEALPLVAPIIEPALRSIGLGGLKPPGMGG